MAHKTMTPAARSAKALAEMEKILKAETLGFLGLAKDDMPYIVPLTYAYRRGGILFHCALTGKKLDYLRANPRVCFTVGKQFGRIVRHPQGAQCRSRLESVICYGNAHVIDGMEERWKALNVFNRRLQPLAKKIPREAVSRCFAVEIQIERMTGRRKWEGTSWNNWQYDFKARRGERKK